MNEDNELMFTRRLMCALIERAVLDAKNDNEYESAANRRDRYDNQISALKFFQSAFYRDLCQALGDCSGIGLPADKIKMEALK